MTPERTGRLRLLAGMVIANRPWRLVLGMRSALAAVMATSAYLVITSTIWQLASSLSMTKLLVTMVAAVIMMVVWIIGAHHLWRSRDELGEGWDPLLWNASTVLTLLVGVVTMAVAVFAFNIVVTVFFLEPPVYSSDAATWPGFVDHLRLAWLATGFATVAGAVGSGLDSDAAVEAAAYEGEQRREASRENSSSG
jgi:hypothetical protein